MMTDMDQDNKNSYANEDGKDMDPSLDPSQHSNIAKEAVHHDARFRPLIVPNRPTAEVLAAEAMAADMEMWITYVPSESRSRREPFEQWLPHNLPSLLSRSDGVGWISVRAPESTGGVGDPRGLQDSWEELKASGRTITHERIVEIAKANNVLNGKWLFHTSTGLKVDHLWSLIARGVVEGRCGVSAKVSPFEPEGTNSQKHVVCIYNDDFSNYDQVLELENSIRAVGIKCPLTYKPDAYTYIGIYRNNEWDMPPTIYRSVYDIIKGCSTVSESRSYLQAASSASRSDGKTWKKTEHAEEAMEVEPMESADAHEHYQD